MTAALLALSAVIGAIIGSFLNALLWRMRSGESVADGRSYCPLCGHVLGVLDLVPILSFAFLRGKCRYCSKRIHPSYFWVEAATATLFVLFASQALSGGVFGERALLQLLLNWFVAASLVAVFAYDMRYMLIPRRITAAATGVALVAGVVLGASLPSLAWGMIIGGGIFYVQYVISKGAWIGGGDIHVGIMMGAVLGLKGVLIALFLSYVLGAAFGLALIAFGRKEWGSQIPFGTFLTASTALIMLAGDPVLAWYVGLLQ